MITFQVEAFSEIFDEVRTLLPLHWKELALNQDKVELDPQYDIYRQKEADGTLFIVTARYNAKIVGYYCGFIGRALHYKSMLTCLPDIYFLHPDLRRQDLGTKMFEFIRHELKKRGVQYWVVGDKNHSHAGDFLEKNGFTKIENYFSQWIGD